MVVSAREIVAANAAIIGSVPALGQAHVCDLCLGPVVGYTRCIGCKRLFADSPHSLRGRVVPMSTANNPSPWYSAIVNYKNGSTASHTLVAALIATFVAQHTEKLNALLGGDFTQVVVVPSTRGRAFDVHPLPKAIRRIVALKDRLSNSLFHVPRSTIGRQEYKPSIFTVDTPAVAGGRILLIEDLWVSGAKAASGAGALLQAGASSVVILPVVREYRSATDFCSESYAADAAVPYVIGRWPRAEPTDA